MSSRLRLVKIWMPPKGGTLREKLESRKWKGKKVRRIRNFKFKRKVLLCWLRLNRRIIIYWRREDEIKRVYFTSFFLKGDDYEDKYNKGHRYKFNYLPDF
jgi:hypothetical protein